MPRKLRLEYSGAIYHVMNRGDPRENIFRDEEDRRRFLATLGEACAKTEWQVHAYCLMGNHFHLVLETPQANLVAGMKWLLGVYTNRFNRRHKLFGHLFSGRYKSLLVDRSGDGYLKTVCDYVHLNPARAKLLKPDQRLRTFAWSSWPLYLLAPSKRPAWLRVDRLLREYRIPKDSVAGRRALEQEVEGRRQAENVEAYRPLRRGWFVGGKAMREELLAAVSTQAGGEHYGEELRESAAAKAQRLITRELARQKWKEADLKKRPKGHTFKVALAQRLRAETTMTVDWIARRLSMGTRGHVTHLLYWQSRRKPNRK